MRRPERLEHACSRPPADGCVTMALGLGERAKLASELSHLARKALGTHTASN